MGAHSCARASRRRERAAGQGERARCGGPGRKGRPESARRRRRLYGGKRHGQLRELTHRRPRAHNEHGDAGGGDQRAGGVWRGAQRPVTQTPRLAVLVGRAEGWCGHGCSWLCGLGLSFLPGLRRGGPFNFQAGRAVCGPATLQSVTTLLKCRLTTLACPSKAISVQTSYTVVRTWSAAADDSVAAGNTRADGRHRAVAPLRRRRQASWPPGGGRRFAGGTATRGPGDAAGGSLCAQRLRHSKWRYSRQSAPHCSRSRLSLGPSVVSRGRNLVRAVASGGGSRRRRAPTGRPRLARVRPERAPVGYRE